MDNISIKTRVLQSLLLVQLFKVIQQIYVCLISCMHFCYKKRLPTTKNAKLENYYFIKYLTDVIFKCLFDNLVLPKNICFKQIMIKR